MEQRWRVPVGGLKARSTLDSVEDWLCEQRGVSDTDREGFFEPQWSRDVYDPYLMEGMEEAVARIGKAVVNKERVLVYGDYDMDGISATAVLLEALDGLRVSALPYLPHRIDDGYGLNLVTLEQLLPAFDLLITVDCGISNAMEVAWLAERGKEVLVLDHHEIPSDLPQALAVLHPRHPDGSYPFAQLCGAGVAYKLAQALARSKAFIGCYPPDWEKWLMDLPLLGTVADMMPLLGENRALVRFGLEVLRRTRRLGLSVMLDELGLSRATVGVEDLGFRVIPLFNAAGRIDHPQAGLDVLLARSPIQAQRSVERLIALNKERQAMTRRMAKEAEGQLDLASPVLFVTNTAWSAGVVGLVAGQLARKFAKPAVVIGGNGKHAVGSARSVPGVNILASLRAAQGHMIKMGGHAEAAGFSIEEAGIKEMQEVVWKHFSEQEGAADVAGGIQTDGVLDQKIIGWDLWRMLERFEPFGKGNAKPQFVFQGVEVAAAAVMGKKADHARFRFMVDGQAVGGVGFGLAGVVSQMNGQVVDMVGSVDVNHYRGRSDLQVRVEDIALTGAAQVVES